MMNVNVVSVFFVRECTFWLNEQRYLFATPDRGLRTQKKKEDKHWNKYQADSGETLPRCEFF